MELKFIFVILYTVWVLFSYAYTWYNGAEFGDLIVGFLIEVFTVIVLTILTIALANIWYVVLLFALQMINSLLVFDDSDGMVQ